MRVLTYSALLLVMTGVALAASPDLTTQFYDHDGLPRGRSEQQGNRTQYFDQSGLPRGYTVQSGHTITRYGQDGLPRGTATLKP